MVNKTNTDTIDLSNVRACARIRNCFDDQSTYDRSPGDEHKCIVTNSWRNTAFSLRKGEKIKR